VVDANGLPQDIKVQRSLGMGLDEEAIKAVKRWRFQPAMKDGKPVPVMINVQVNFRLYDDLYPNPDSTRHPPSSATNQPAPTPNGSNLPSQTPDQTRPQGYQTTKGEYEKAAAAGDVAAMSALGDLYYFGDGVPQDYRKAREWYEKAASEGDAVAMRYLANLYYHGQEVQQDYQKAREWNEKAADGGDAVAMGNLGLQYYHGQGAPQDYQKAREWFEKAASSGNARAMINLAHMYYQGEGVSQSDQKSKEWLEKAAAKGDAYAQQVLGTMPNTAAVPERTKGISIHLLPKRVADLGGMGWGLSVDNRNLLGESEPPVLQTPQEFLSFVRRQDTAVQENGVWIVMTDPDAYSNFEKVLLEDIKALCRAEKIPLFICRAIDLPNGWKRYDQ
jgi:TonB family protein